MNQAAAPRVRVRRTVHHVTLLQVADEVCVQILDVARLRLEIHPAAGREDHSAMVAAVGVHQALATHPDAVLHDGGAHRVAFHLVGHGARWSMTYQAGFLR
eukprot:6485047-Prymnesium_polylepis.1